ncbi:DUF86 domain-containing protein [bacterium]|nr:DUF86 domain-containing protein [bacterium]
MRDYKLYLQDILDAINAIEKFVGKMEFDDFTDDDKTQSAVIRKFEIIGEATKNIPDSIKMKYPQIPWKRMAGMRDKLIHFYFGVNPRLVWQTIKHRIPELKPLIEQVIGEKNEGE